VTAQYTAYTGDRTRMMEELQSDLDQWEEEGYTLVELVHGDDDEGCHVLVVAHRDDKPAGSEVTG